MINVYRRQRGAIMVFDAAQTRSSDTPRVTLRHHRYAHPGQGVLRYDPELRRHVYTFDPNEIDFVGECEVILRLYGDLVWSGTIRVLPNKEPSNPLVYFEIAQPDADDRVMPYGWATETDLDRIAWQGGITRRAGESDSALRARVRLAFCQTPSGGTLDGIRVSVESVPGVVAVRSIGDNMVSGQIDLVVEIQSYTASAIMRAEIMEVLDAVRPAGTAVNLEIFQRCGHCGGVHDDRVACSAYAAWAARTATE